MTAHGKILIIGGGMGGLTLAIALIRNGMAVEVHEQAPELKELGAGLTLPSNAMRVFDAIGIWDKVKEICARSSGAAFVHYQTLELLTGNHSYGWEDHPTSSDQGAQTHRGLVHALLVAELMSIAPGSVFLNHKLKHLEQDDTGVRVTFENGDKAEGSLMVGCDGIAGVTQGLLFGRTMPTEFTGVVAYRALIPRTASLEPYLSGGRSQKFVGPARGLNRYGLAGGQLLNCVALVKTDIWEQEGWSHQASREELLSLFSDFHEDCQQVIKHAPEDQIFKWGLRDREPLPTWQSDRVTLLGDSAHPMLPYQSQGACSAIEDAMVLSRCLLAYRDYDEAFKAYEADRLPRTTMLMRKSREQGDALNQVDPYDFPNLKPNRDAIVNYDPVTVSI